METRYDSRSYSGVAGTGSATSALDPIEPGSVVRDGLSANEGTLAELHETINRLEGRLEPALTPIPPQPANTSTSTPATGPPRSHVANRVASLDDGYRHALRRLQDLIRRVEV